MRSRVRAKRPCRTCAQAVQTVGDLCVKCHFVVGKLAIVVLEFGKVMPRALHVGHDVQDVGAGTSVGGGRRYG